MSHLLMILASAYGHLKRINFTQLTQITAMRSSTVRNNSTSTQPDRTLLGKRSTPVASPMPSTPSSSSPSSLKKVFQTPFSKSTTQKPDVHTSVLPFSNTSKNGMWFLYFFLHSILFDITLEMESADTSTSATLKVDRQDKGATPEADGSIILPLPMIRPLFGLRFHQCCLLKGEEYLKQLLQKLTLLILLSTIHYQPKILFRRLRQYCQPKDEESEKISIEVQSVDLVSHIGPTEIMLLKLELGYC